ncbi:Sex peptide receptor [Halotydeus destructor]|nr:Sex peptide receptor [Halotydeus destructor]
MVSATNAILTGLAAADMLVMADYVPFAFHNYCRKDRSDSELFTYGWAVYTLFHAHISVVCHTISTWLTVLLAVWRYIAVSYPTESRIWCSMSRTRWAILWTYVAVAVGCTPLYVSFTIIQEQRDGHTIYRVDWNEMARDGLMKQINFWVFSVGTKLVPCILLTYLSLTLVKALMEADKRKRRLKAGPSTAITPRGSSNALSNNVNSSNSAGPVRSHTSHNDRTTKMLLCVLLLFLITEFPSGILVLLAGVIGDDFFRQVYYPLGELLDILALLNSGINFILYCIMSTAFRATFAQLFCFKAQSDRRAASATVTGPHNGEMATIVEFTAVNHNSVSVSCSPSSRTTVSTRDRVSSTVNPTPV